MGFRCQLPDCATSCQEDKKSPAGNGAKALPFSETRRVWPRLAAGGATSRRHGVPHRRAWRAAVSTRTRQQLLCQTRPWRARYGLCLARRGHYGHAARGSGDASTLAGPMTVAAARQIRGRCCSARSVNPPSGPRGDHARAVALVNTGNKTKCYLSFPVAATSAGTAGGVRHASCSSSYADRVGGLDLLPPWSPPGRHPGRVPPRGKQNGNQN